MGHHTPVSSLIPAHRSWSAEGSQKRISPLGQDEILMGTMKGSSGIGFSLSLHEPKSMDEDESCPALRFLFEWHGVSSSLIEYTQQ